MAKQVARGDVFLVDLVPTRGGEIRKPRPCLVVSPDEIHRAAPGCIVAPMTTGNHPYRFRVPCRFDGKSGHVIADQLRSVDETRLLRRLGRLSQPTVLRVLHVLQEMFTP